MKLLESIIKNIDPITALAIITFLLAVILYLWKKLQKERDKLKNAGDPNQICMNDSESSIQTLSESFIKGIIHNYRTSDSYTQNETTESVRFDLMRLKKFIYHIEKNATLRGKPIGDLGIRFYFAEYSLDENNECFPHFDDKSDEYTMACAGRKTLVMVPTCKALSNSTSNDYEHVDFDANNEDTLLANHEDLYNRLSYNNIEFSALNKGTLFPPMN